MTDSEARGSRRRGLTVLAAAMTATAFVSIAAGDRASSSAASQVPESTTQASTAQVSPEARAQLHLVEVTAPEPMSPVEFEHVQRMRELYGLRSDPEFVQSVYDDPAGHRAVRSEWGLFASLMIAPDEVPQMQLRALQDVDSQGASEAVRLVLGDAFAGAFLEGTTYVVQCARCDVGSLAAAIRSAHAVKESLESNLDLRVVARSEPELQELAREVEDFLVKTEAKTNGYGAMPMANLVEVHLGPSSTPGIGQLLQERFGADAVRIVEDPGDAQPYSNKNTYLVYGQVEGGQAIKREGSADYDCTSGFSVQSGYGPFMLTAGHCAGSTWVQGGATLGVVAAQSQSGYFDAEAITTYGYRTNRPRFHHTYSDDFAPVTFVPGNFDDLMNQPVCQAGRTTTGNSGNLNLTARCGPVTTLTYDHDGGGATWQPTFLYASHIGDFGDSGASIVWATQWGWAAVGILHGGPNPGGCCVWSSRMDIMLYIWGMQLTPYP